MFFSNFIVTSLLVYQSSKESSLVHLSSFSSVRTEAIALPFHCHYGLKGLIRGSERVCVAVGMLLHSNEQL
jgi:hypothetical protein